MTIASSPLIITADPCRTPREAVPDAAHVGLCRHPRRCPSWFRRASGEAPPLPPVPHCSENVLHGGA